MSALKHTLVHLLVTFFIFGFIVTFYAPLKPRWPWTHEVAVEVVQETSVSPSLGIKQLAPGDSPAVDIVAIHGLDGHRENSWTIKNVLWLRDLLPNEIPTARILTYGYDANTRGHVQLSSQTLYDHAETFLAKLASFRQKTDTQDRPIIFVAHSLGGIVLKYALIQANAATRSHLPHHKAIELSTYGIIFLGTPHQGTESVNLASLLLRIQSFYSPTNDAVVKHLGRDSEFLQSQLAQYLVPKSSAVVPGTINVEAIAISKDHVGMAKFVSSEDDDFRTVCGCLTDMASKAPQRVAHKWILYRRSEEILSGTPMNTTHNVTTPSELFTGRFRYLETLRRHFGPRVEQSQRRFLLYGMGGAGKTQICLKFIQENADRFWKVFWIDASSAETIKLSFKDIAASPEAQASHVEESTEAVLQWTSAMDREWLLVFDNADDGPDAISKFIPRGNRGNVLITSRSQSLSRVVSRADSIEVNEMDEEEAISLLLKAAAVEVSPESREVARSIVVQLLFLLPLAIDQAGAAIQGGLCSINDYSQMYSEHRERLLDDPLFKGASDYGRAVYGTWDLSYHAIKDRATRHRNSRDAGYDSAIIILETFAFLHHENIAEAIFKRAAETPTPRGRDMIDPNDHSFPTIPEPPLRLLQLGKNGRWDPMFFREGIRVLLSFSLVRRGASDNAYSVHGLVHSWSRDRIPGVEQQTKCHSANALLYHSITIKFSSEDNAFRRSLIPHIQANAQFAAEAGVAKVYNDDEYSSFWLVYYQNGDLKEAEELGIQVTETRKKVLGMDHPDTLESMNNLASTYMRQGRLKEAEELQVRVVEARKAVLGADHPSTLTSMHNLASTYLEQGRFTEAEELQVRVMETRNVVLDADHPDILAGMNNLAMTYREQGRWNEAEELHVRVMETAKAVLGANHSSTLTSMNNLAMVYEKQGLWKEAEELHVRVLEAMKAVLGANHLDTLTSMNNLATVYTDQGRYEEAEKMHARIMETTMVVLGADHPSTLATMDNLAAIYLRQKRIKEAEELLVRVMERRQAALGANHPTTLATMNSLALTYWQQGRSKEAVELQVRVVEARKAVLGVDHPETLTTMDNLASTHLHEGRLKEAEELQVQVMEGRKAVLGADDPSVLTSMANLAATYLKQTRLKEAEELQVRVVERRKAVLGEEHSDTLMSMNNLAAIYLRQKRIEGSEELLVQVMETRKGVLGEDHADTIKSMNSLAMTYGEQGQWKQAEKLQVRVIKTSKAVLGAKHPSTLTTMHNLALTYRHQGLLKKAEELLVRAVETRKGVLGEDHPDTIKSMNILAMTYWEQGLWKQAEELLVRVIEGMKAVVGDDHPEILTNMMNLARTYQNQGRLKETEELVGRTVEKMKRVYGPDHAETLAAISFLRRVLP